MWARASGLSVCLRICASASTSASTSSSQKARPPSSASRPALLDLSTFTRAR
eukprot:CAMPEP_0175420438 /NCGR_PEP_ID=MMETSP0095-20121207/46737_1 /TAXON_ID=311494 /ORGANISM="Alexandrium monilatum, Strain CCMP3105" /LENGTH=51 /DNA_ID=CAMNT_0016719645 /DNA_START=383 /DNA_END=534 /DNA_ORIENTATION=+